MAATFKFELVSPERILMSADAEQVIVPGAEGEFTVLPLHAPVISALRPGVIRASLSDGKKRIYVRSGFADVTPQALTILAERAFIVDEIDPEMLEQELDAVQAALDSANDDEARLHLAIAIEELKALQAGKVAA